MGKMRKAKSMEALQLSRSDSSDGTDDETGSSEVPGSPKIPELTPEQIDAMIEGVSSKNAATQVDRCKALANTLLKCGNFEEIEEKGEVLADGLRRLLKGSRKEEPRSAALRLMGIATACIAFPTNVVDELCEELQRFSSDSASPTHLVAQAIHTLCLLSLFSQNPDDASPANPCNVMPTLAARFTGGLAKADPEVVAAAIEGHTLVSVVHRNLAPLKAVKETLVRLLENPAPDVSISAAQSLALLAEVSGEASDKEANGALKQAQMVIQEQNSYSHGSKHERKTKRTALRAVLSTLESGQPPSEVVAVGGKTVTFSSWSDLIVVGALREVLESGFPLHLQRNESVRRLLGLEEVDLNFKKRTKKEKKESRLDRKGADKGERIKKNERTRSFADFEFAEAEGFEAG